MSRPTTTSSRLFHSVLPAEEQFDTFGKEFFDDNSAPSAVAPPTNSANSSGVVDNRQSTMIRAGDYASRLSGLPAAKNIGENNVEMDNASVSSAGTSIFHGQAMMCERLSATRSSRRDLSSEISCFAKLYDDALESGVDVDKKEADLLRPVVVRMAESFILHVQSSYPSDVGDDYSAKALVAGYLSQMQKRFIKRPPFYLKQETACPFPDPNSVFNKAGMGNKRLCSSSFMSQPPPADKALRTEDAAAVEDIRAERAPPPLASTDGAAGTASPPAPRKEREKTTHGSTLGAVGGAVTNGADVLPPTDQPEKRLQVEAWTESLPQRPMTSPFADAPLAKTTPGVIPPGARPKQRRNAALPDSSTPPRLPLLPSTPTVFPPPPKVTINPATGERMALLHDLQRHRTIADEEAQRQEKEKRDLTEKVERLRRMRKEEEERKESARIEDIIQNEKRARDEQVQRVAENEEELQRMREEAAALEREEPPRDAPEQPEVITIEDEMELGAESDGFTTVRNNHATKKNWTSRNTFEVM